MSVNKPFFQSLTDGKNFKEALNSAMNLHYLTPYSIDVNMLLLHWFIVFGHIRSACRVVKNLKALRTNSVVTAEELKLRQLIHQQHSAQKLYSECDYKACLSAVNKSLEIAPQSAHLRLLKAKSFIRLNDADEAEKLIMEILKENPDNSDATFRLGVVRFYQGDLDESYRLVKDSVDQEPEDENRWKMFQTLFSLVDLIKKAKIHCSDLNYNEAISIYSKLIDENDKHSNLLRVLLELRANAFKMSSRFSNAIDDCSRVLAYNHLEEILLLRAVCNFSIEDYDSCFKDCILMKPSNPEANKLMEKVLKEQKNINMRDQKQQEEAQKFVSTDLLKDILKDIQNVRKNSKRKSKKRKLSVNKTR